MCDRLMEGVGEKGKINGMGWDGIDGDEMGWNQGGLVLSDPKDQGQGRLSQYVRYGALG